MNNDQTPETPTTGTSDLARAIADAVEAGRENKKVTIATLKRRSVFNPKGQSRKARALPANTTFWQNGVRLVVSRLHDEEIELLRALTPIMRAVQEVRAVHNLVVADMREISVGSWKFELMYSTKTGEQRMALSQAIGQLGGNGLRTALADVLRAAKEAEAAASVPQAHSGLRQRTPTVREVA